MAKQRTSIPTKIRHAILKEYHHGCARCLEHVPAPELHHIDEDPSNHDPLNLLPLCPNCHSLKLNPTILSLFRKYKRSEILSVEFELLYDKAAFIFKLPLLDYYPQCFYLGEDLAAFISPLKQGKYYAQKIDRLVRADSEQESVEELEIFHKQRCEAITELMIELLPYQGWKPKLLS